MNISYLIEEDFEGIRNYSLYEIEDTDESFVDWRSLQKDFVREFQEFSSEDLKDYELPEWHDGIKCLWVYLYNDRFYNRDFINRVLNVLDSNGDCFAEFECYNSAKKYIGHFQVYKEKVYFNENSEHSGLINKLFG